MLCEAYFEDVVCASRDDPTRVEVFAALAKLLLPENNLDGDDYELVYVFAREAGQVVAGTRKLVMVELNAHAAAARRDCILQLVPREQHHRR